MTRKSYKFTIAISVLFLIFFWQFFERERRSKLDEEELQFARNLTFIPSFHHYNPDYFTAFQYNITTCSIRKSMSQMVFNTMCLLHDSEHFLQGNHTLNETWKQNRTCNYEDPDGFATFPRKFKRTSDFTRLVFIRDPFERFLSLYLDKCVREHFCFDCMDDMRCVLKNIYKSLKKFIAEGESTENDWFMNQHSAPISWFCDFDEYLKAYHVLIIGRHIEDRKSPIMKLSKILERKEVPEHIISKIVHETLLGETSHGTSDSSHRNKAAEQIKRDPIVREYLHKIYFNDYLIFPFDKSHLDLEYQNAYWEEKFNQDYAGYIKKQDSNAHLLN